MGAWKACRGSGGSLVLGASLAGGGRGGVVKKEGVGGGVLNQNHCGRLPKEGQISGGRPVQKRPSKPAARKRFRGKTVALESIQRALTP
jgi:hypothetical protein